VRVLLGSYGGLSHPIPAPSPLHYLDGKQAAGERWSFQPPSGHCVAWVFVCRCEATVEGDAIKGERPVLEPGEGSVALQALAPSRLLLGSTVLHDHPLLVGSHPVHTSREALLSGWLASTPSGSTFHQRGGSECGPLRVRPRGGLSSSTASRRMALRPAAWVNP
jgi:hypothetical protein